MTLLSLSVRVERWPIAGAFTISRGAKTEAVVVVAELDDGRRRGRGECVPYARYGETVEGVAAAIEAQAARRSPRVSIARRLQTAMPAGRRAQRARLRALGPRGQARRPAGARACWGSPAPRPLTTAFTISLAAPEEMARAAAQGRRPRRCSRSSSAARTIPRASPPCARAAPRAELIVDANEGWTADNLGDNLGGLRAGRRHSGRAAAARRARRRAGADVAAAAGLRRRERAMRARRSRALVGKYDAVNIKLDKTGGLTEALALAREAERLGFKLMVGCMVGDLARHGAGDAGGAARPRGRPRRPAAAGARPPGWLALRGQPRAPADRGAVGMTATIRPYALGEHRDRLRRHGRPGRRSLLSEGR